MQFSIYIMLYPHKQSVNDSGMDTCWPFQGAWLKCQLSLFVVLSFNEYLCWHSGLGAKQIARAVE